MDGVPHETDTTSTHEGDTVAGFETVADQVWTCTVMATDGESSVSSAAVSVTPEWKFMGWGEEPFALDEAAAQLFGTGPTEQAGTTLARAGDIDGDGAPDLLIGSPTSDAGENNAGRAYVAMASHFSGGLFLETSEVDAVRIFESRQNNARFGQGIAGNHDVGGTDTPDIAIGGHNYDYIQCDGKDKGHNHHDDENEDHDHVVIG